MPYEYTDDELILKLRRALIEDETPMILELVETALEQRRFLPPDVLKGAVLWMRAVAGMPEPIGSEDCRSGAES